MGNSPDEVKSRMDSKTAFVIRSAQISFSRVSIICSDGDSFVPNNGCFGRIGHLPPDGLPCVPGKSIFGRPCLPVMTSPLPEQLVPEWRGVLSTDSTWNSCRKLFCLASIFVFSRVYQNILYIYKSPIYFWINLVSISPAWVHFERRLGRLTEVERVCENSAVWCASHHCLGVAASSAMLGPGRIGTRGILRGINQVRVGFVTEGSIQGKFSIQ